MRDTFREAADLANEEASRQRVVTPEDGEDNLQLLLQLNPGLGQVKLAVEATPNSNNSPTYGDNCGND